MWFENLTGFKEQSPKQVRSNIEIEGTTLRSLVNGKEFNFGYLDCPSLAELRSRTP